MCGPFPGVLPKLLAHELRKRKSLSSNGCLAVPKLIVHAVCADLVAMTESGYYYYTHPFTEDERLSLKEFFGRDLFDGSKCTAGDRLAVLSAVVSSYCFGQ